MCLTKMSPKKQKIIVLAALPLVLLLGIFVSFSWFFPGVALFKFPSPESSQIVSATDMGPGYVSEGDGAAGVPFAENATTVSRRFTIRGASSGLGQVTLAKYADAQTAQKALQLVVKAHAWPDVSAGSSRAQISRKTSEGNGTLTFHAGTEGVWLILVLVQGGPTLDTQIGEQLYGTQLNKLKK